MFKQKRDVILDELKIWLKSLPEEERNRKVLVLGFNALSPKEIVAHIEKQTEEGKKMREALFSAVMTFLRRGWIR